jgi:AraC-like DNA-binding protein
MFNIQTFRPDPLLRKVVSRYLLVNVDLESACGEFCFLPKVNQQISFNLGTGNSIYDPDNREYIANCNLIGQYNRICRLTVFDGMNRIIVNLHPLGWYKLFGIPAQCFLNRNTDLQPVLGSEILDLQRHLQISIDIKKQIMLLDSFFLDRLFSPRYDHRNIEHAVQLITEAKGNISINQVERETFITRRTLERHFLEQTGLYPKMFAQIVRFNEAIKCLEKNQRPNWANFASYLGYCDQSHFINEFRRFAGCRPGRYSVHRQEFEPVPVS